MNKIYKSIVFVLILTLKMDLKAQVLSANWFETFENMPVNAPPTGGWMAVGGFSVFGSPHGSLMYGGSKALSKNLFSNTGPNNVDSLIGPRTTMMNCGFYSIKFEYRICNWAGGVPTTSTTLGAGDTCFVSICKYAGTSIAGSQVIYKIHKTASTQTNTTYTYIDYSSCNYPFLSSDTVALRIKVKRGNAGDYWYDFDNIYFGPTVLVKEYNKGLNVELFPNPVKDDLTLRFNQNEVLKSVSIKNSLGQGVLFRENFDQNKIVNINVSDFKTGIYFVEILLKNGQKTVTKLFKE